VITKPKVAPIQNSDIAIKKNIATPVAAAKVEIPRIVE
jgi:hypothetical protein